MDYLNMFCQFNFTHCKGRNKPWVYADGYMGLAYPGFKNNKTRP